MDEKGFFGDLFDLNNDGSLDSFEQSVDFGAFMEIMNDAEKEEDEN